MFWKNSEFVVCLGLGLGCRIRLRGKGWVMVRGKVNNVSTNINQMKVF